jgi:hypothetical protein
MDKILSGIMLWLGFTVMIAVFLYAGALSDLIIGAGLLVVVAALMFAIPVGIGATFYNASNSRGLRILGFIIGFAVLGALIWFLVLPMIEEHLMRAMESMVNTYAASS